jgi:hypothetical protein
MIIFVVKFFISDLDIVYDMNLLFIKYLLFRLYINSGTCLAECLAGWKLNIFFQIWLNILDIFNFVWNMDKLELCEVIYRYGVKITSLMICSLKKNLQNFKRKHLQSLIIILTFHVFFILANRITFNIKQHTWS